MISIYTLNAYDIDYVVSIAYYITHHAVNTLMVIKEIELCSRHTETFNLCSLVGHQI